MRALNLRIVRLARTLGLTLQDERDLARAMNRAPKPAPSTERRSMTERRTEARPGTGPDRRTAHQWEELRGLLVLRYGVEKSCLDEFGIDVTRRIMTDGEAELERQGFERGADGIDLARRFGPG